MDENMQAVLDFNLVGKSSGQWPSNLKPEVLTFVLKTCLCYTREWYFKSRELDEGR